MCIGPAWPVPRCMFVLRLVLAMQSIEAVAGEVDEMRRQPSPLAAAQAAKQEVLADQRKFQEVIAGNQVQALAAITVVLDSQMHLSTSQLLLAMPGKSNLYTTLV